MCDSQRYKFIVLFTFSYTTNTTCKYICVFSSMKSEQNIEPFWSNISILDLLKTPENQKIFGVFVGEINGNIGLKLVTCIFAKFIPERLQSRSVPSWGF